MRPVVAVILWGMLIASCGGGGPDGSCVTDYDCETDQLCGTAGRCLLCDNCERGRMGTCTAPAWPLQDPPDAIRLESRQDRDMLFYLYRCEGAETSYRYDRLDGWSCFDPEPLIDDGCGFEE